MHDHLSSVRTTPRMHRHNSSIVHYIHSSRQHHMQMLPLDQNHISIKTPSSWHQLAYTPIIALKAASTTSHLTSPTASPTSSPIGSPIASPTMLQSLTYTPPLHINHDTIPMTATPQLEYITNIILIQDQLQHKHHVITNSITNCINNYTDRIL